MDVGGTMRASIKSWMVLVPMVHACGGETEFSSTPDNTIPETGVAELALSVDEIVIEEVNYEAQISKSATFSISNEGDNTLQLYFVGLADSGDGVFYIEEETDLSLMPGISRDFTIVATLPDFVAAEGTVRIRSNDSEYIDHRLPVSAYPVGWEGSGGGDTGMGGDDTGSESSAEDTGSAAESG